jgi:hypothetical protein
MTHSVINTMANVGLQKSMVNLVHRDLFMGMCSYPCGSKSLGKIRAVYKRADIEEYVQILRLAYRKEGESNDGYTCKV